LVERAPLHAHRAITDDDWAQMRTNEPIRLLPRDAEPLRHVARREQLILEGEGAQITRGVQRLQAASLRLPRVPRGHLTDEQVQPIEQLVEATIGEGPQLPQIVLQELQPKIADHVVDLIICDRSARGLSCHAKRRLNPRDELSPRGRAVLQHRGDQCGPCGL